MEDTDIVLPRDGNRQVIRALKHGILGKVKTVSVLAGATPLNPTPHKWATILHVYLPAGANIDICDVDGNVMDTISAGPTGRKFIVDAINEAQKTFYAKGGAPTNVQVAELG